MLVTISFCLGLNCRGLHPSATLTSAAVWCVFKDKLQLCCRPKDGCTQNIQGCRCPPLEPRVLRRLQPWA